MLAKGYCLKHYTQIKTYGKILKRTKFDPNEIITYDDYAEIILYKFNKEIAKAKIDLEDVERCKEYKWYLKNNNGKQYVVTKKDGNNSYRLHRFLLNPKNEFDIDHINGDGLDNRKCNLRICTHQQNMCNQKINKANTSGVTGVSWSKKYNKWLSRIVFKNKTIHLGYFENFEDAVKIRKEAELKYFGEFTNNKGEI